MSRNGMSRIADLDQELKAAGIPIQGLSGTRENCQIIFDGEPTAQQRIDAAAILAAFDWDGLSPADTNAASMRTKIRNAISNLESADTNWATLTNPQKDAAMRLAVRVAAKLGRLELSQLDSD